ncbi:hypothetical protein CDIK_2544 [Cucumispora dikerogammari]|nr:hypothetical protein CDIK_2544 [Cucumispora dikerogammari]
MVYCKVISNSTVNAEFFSEYINESCIYLRDVKLIENACLILDNAQIHKREDIQRIVSQYNYTFNFLSLYSYMLNPIENVFSKVKNGVRSKLRLGITGALSEILLAETLNITSKDSNGYFRHILRNITTCAAELLYIHQ